MATGPSKFTKEPNVIADYFEGLIDGYLETCDPSRVVYTNKGIRILLGHFPSKVVRWELQRRYTETAPEPWGDMYFFPGDEETVPYVDLDYPD
jgi:hypothetical protein